jgi:hypothetical protein
VAATASAGAERARELEPVGFAAAVGGVPLGSAAAWSRASSKSHGVEEGEVGGDRAGALERVGVAGDDGAGERALERHRSPGASLRKHEPLRALNVNAVQAPSRRQAATQRSSGDVEDRLEVAAGEVDVGLEVVKRSGMGASWARAARGVATVARIASTTMATRRPRRVRRTEPRLRGGMRPLLNVG